MKYYIGVASKNHIAFGKEGGFCQFCHGKEFHAKKIKSYSPKVIFGMKKLSGDINKKNDKVKKFVEFSFLKTAILYCKDLDMNSLKYKRVAPL